MGFSLKSLIWFWAASGIWWWQVLKLFEYAKADPDNNMGVGVLTLFCWSVVLIGLGLRLVKP